MKRFAVVALREIVERRFVLLAAGVAAFIPFLVPLLPGVPAINPASPAGSRRSSSPAPSASGGAFSLAPRSWAASSRSGGSRSTSRTP